MNNNKWYIEKGDEGDVVMSTRIRLARNLRDYPFPARLDVQGREKINALIADAAMSGDCGFFLINMKELSRAQTVSLAERHLISPEFAANTEGRALLMTEDESVSIMLCEEDHIRLQVMQAGLRLREAYDMVDKIDKFLGSRLDYAFDERLGYLTQCPTNLGTAMRASVMLHLPALTRSGRISRLASSVSKLGLVIRGSYGEGSGPRGDLYQMSNQITLGITEENAIENLRAITLRLIAQEREAAKELLKNPAEEDRVWRALGLLRSARLMSCDEFMELISLVRMGVAGGLIELDMEKINELLINMQPATINAEQGKNLEPGERDVIRAEKVRAALT